MFNPILERARTLVPLFMKKSSVESKPKKKKNKERNSDFAETVKSARKLDYAGAEIRMCADSHWEQYRLGSVRKEPWTVEWIEKSLKAGDVFYDIGANVGAYALIAAKQAAGTVKVVAFEPSFSNYRTLCLNIKLNNLDETVLPLPIALSEKSELVHFNYRSVDPGAAKHSMSAGNVTTRKEKVFYRQPVLAFTLDSLLETYDLPKPTHIKLDVDGAELLVLRGAHKTLASSTVRSVLAEIYDHQKDEACGHFESVGYALEKVTRREKPGKTFDFAYYQFEKKA